jgi:hypothetical protein
MCTDESPDIVLDGVTDPAVGTALPLTAGNHIPEGYAFSQEVMAAPDIGKLGRDTKELFHHRPEPVFRISVILMMREREGARETAEDKYAGQFSTEWRETPAGACSIRHGSRAHKKNYLKKRLQWQ